MRCPIETDKDKTIGPCPVTTLDEKTIMKQKLTLVICACILAGFLMGVGICLAITCLFAGETITWGGAITGFIFIIIAAGIAFLGDVVQRQLREYIQQPYIIEEMEPKDEMDPAHN